MTTDVKTKLLDTAQAMVQCKGYQGFSFHQLSKAVGITTASIHYHFPTKAKLAVALLQRHVNELESVMQQILNSEQAFTDKLRSLARVYETTLSKKQICSCSAMAGEFDGLPKEVQEELDRMICGSIRDITKLLDQGSTSGSINSRVATKELAKLWYCTLQGSLNLGRASSPAIFEGSIESLIHLTVLKKERE